MEAKIPILLQYLDKLCRAHSGTHPELLEIRELFEGCGQELSLHMKKEEIILFPYIKEMENARRMNTQMHAISFDTVDDPIAMMMSEHDHEGVRFRRIAELSNNYTPPADGCNTYKVTYSMLNDFEKDLHEHIHLENNILFPRAKQLEKQLMNLV